MWRRSLSGEYGAIKNHHGLGGSLAQSDDAVFVLVDHAGPSYLLAASKATGKTLWKADRPSGMSWTSPVLNRHGGRDLVLVSGNGTLVAYDSKSGKPWWKMEGLSGNLIPSPVVSDDLVVVGAGECGLTSDRKVAARSNCCVRLTLKEDEPGHKFVWQGKKAVCHHASPVVHLGHVYLVTKAGLVYCLDLKTGEERYVERLKSPCWATPVAAGEHVYFIGKDGVTTVLKAGPSYEQVASNRLWDDEVLAARVEELKKKPENKFLPLSEQGRKEMEAMLEEAVGDVVYGVAAVDGAFYLRTGTELYCVRNRK